MPGPNDKFFQTPESRAFIKVPINMDNADFLKVRQSIDEHFQTDSMKQQLLGEKWKKYEYSPIAKAPPDGTDKPPSFKVKLATTATSDNNPHISTQV